MGPTKWTFLPHTQQDFFLLSLTNSIITVSQVNLWLCFIRILIVDIHISGWYLKNKASVTSDQDKP